MSTRYARKTGLNRLSRRRFLRISGGAATGLILVGCGAEAPVPPAAPAAPAPTAAPLAPAATAAPAASAATAAPAAAASAVKANLSSLNIGYDNPNWSHHAADIVAREKGWFDEVGITNAEIITFNNALTAIVGGGVHFTAADSDVALQANVQEGVDIWWLGTRRDHEDLIFGLAPGLTIEDLKGSGKSVSGGTVGSRNELLGKKMLAELGLDPETDVSWVTMSGGSDTRLAALMNGNLSGSNIQERHITQLEAAGGTVIYNKSRTIAQDGYVAMGPFIEENGDTVVAFLTAIIKAKQYIKDLSTKDDVIAIMEKNGYQFSQEFKDAYESNVHNMSPDCGFEIAEMELVWEEISSVGEVAADFAWRDGMNLEFLWKAQEANGLPRRPASL
jgi:ABC-type nitrate/sulfonate/bicarbonate transport system substrate-binding protein